MHEETLRCPAPSFQVKPSHSYVTTVVGLWPLTVTKVILTFKSLCILLPTNPNGHTAKI